MSDQRNSPRAEYLRRLEARRGVCAELDRTHIRLGNARLAIAVAAAGIAWLAWGHHLFSAWWLFLPAVAFVILAVVHERVLRAGKRAARAASFYEKGIARLEDRWAGQGEPGTEFEDAAHPYAEDLDLFGKGSLFELVSMARLRTGERTLAQWLLQPASPDEARARRGAVEELRPRVDLREDLALLGAEVRSGIRPELLARWAEKPLVFDSLWMRITAAGLAVLAVAGGVVWAVFGIPEFLLVVLVIEAGFVLRLRPRLSEVLEGVGEPAYGLALFAAVLARFEREPVTSPRLFDLRKQLEVEGVPPSRRIGKLNRLMELLDSSDHVLVRAVDFPLLYRLQLAFAFEAWRKESGAHVRKWLAATGEIEALCSLANYAYEHPQDVFPDFVSQGPCFDGNGLGHPLIPEGRAVRNDVRLCGEDRVLLVSGSNMSGKSTLLRTVGVNAVLAMAGAPVRAHRLRISQLTIGASIRTLDSLQTGTSRFYAEVKRLRQLVELTNGPRPLLFLLDELLQGTNSHDRRIGAEAIVRSLAERGAIGLLTTHDLALAEIARALAPRARNVHFEDHLEDGQMRFDYLLRPGVVAKSNALELMRSVGLEV